MYYIFYYSRLAVIFEKKREIVQYMKYNVLICYLIVECLNYTQKRIHICEYIACQTSI